MKRIQLFLLLILSTLGINAQRDWDNVPIPPDAGPGRVWQLQEAPSDDFNYTFNPTSANANFGPPGQPKWNNFFHNAFTGPGPTLWRRDHVRVRNGNLEIFATRQPGELGNFVNSQGQRLPASRSGCITNLNRVLFPVFIEARVRVMNSTLASDVWLLSPDDIEEIDIIEAYGGPGNDGRNQFFAERIHLSHHVFIRPPNFRDYQPRDFNSFWRQQGVTQFGGRTVNIGVYWVSSTRLEYYIDGQLQRIVDNNALQSRLVNGQFEFTYPAGVTSTGQDGELFFDTGDMAGFQSMNTASSLQAAQNASNISVIDPFNYLTNGRQFSREMDIIINVEDQSFQAEGGRSPNAQEIGTTQRDNQTMLVDWIRVYKPVPGNNPPPSGNQAPQLSFTNPANGANFNVGDRLGVTVAASDADGSISNVRLSFDGNFVRQENIIPYNWGADNSSTGDPILSNLTAGIHTLQAIATDNSGNTTSSTITINVGGQTPPPPPGGGNSSNLALNKPATQSSDLFGLTASFAVDGNRDNFSHTDENANAWIEIDLQNQFRITQINVWNRPDCCADRLSEYQVFTSDVPFTSKDIVTTANQSGVGVFFQEATAARPTSVNIGGRIARYVRIQLIGTNFLHPSEIEVLGTSVNAARNSGLSSADNTISIFPNPIVRGNDVTIQNTPVNGIMSIVDFAGRTLHKIKVQETNTLLNTSELSSGIYFIIIDNTITKLIVN